MSSNAPIESKIRAASPLQDSDKRAAAEWADPHGWYNTNPITRTEVDALAQIIANEMAEEREKARIVLERHDAMAACIDNWVDWGQCSDYGLVTSDGPHPDWLLEGSERYEAKNK